MDPHSLGSSPTTSSSPPLLFNNNNNVVFKQHQNTVLFINSNLTQASTAASRAADPRQFGDGSLIILLHGAAEWCPNVSNAVVWPSCITLPEALAMSFFVLIGMLVIVLGNLMVVLTVSNDAKMRGQRQNWLLVSLAMADLLVGLLVMPLTLTYEIVGVWVLVWVPRRVHARQRRGSASTARAAERTEVVAHGAGTAMTHNKPDINPDKTGAVPSSRFTLLARLFRKGCTDDSTVQVVRMRSLEKRKRRLKAKERQATLLLGLILFCKSIPLSADEVSSPDPSTSMWPTPTTGGREQQQQNNVDSKTLRNGGPHVQHEQQQQNNVNRTTKEQSNDDSNESATTTMAFDEEHWAAEHDGNECRKQLQSNRDHFLKNPDKTGAVPSSRFTLLARLFRKGCTDDSTVQVVRMRSLEKRKRRLKAKERQATLLLGLILFAFIASWMPFFIMYVLNALHIYAPVVVFKFFFWLGYCNSAINPIIYTYFNREFRRALLRLIRRHQHRFHFLERFSHR
uniref:G_PROTEIN_RECEP_F1_2 domain-containing protein n=1 Tax=Globodera pallida TaxID=36090 RepID=A0A183BKA7_GLOPA